MYICHSFIAAPHVHRTPLTPGVTHPARIRGRFHFGNETADELDVLEGPVRCSQRLASVRKLTENAAYPEKHYFANSFHIYLAILCLLTTHGLLHQAMPTDYAY